MARDHRGRKRSRNMRQSSQRMELGGQHSGKVIDAAGKPQNPLGSPIGQVARRIPAARINGPDNFTCA